ncbi:YaaA family protein [Brachybacterium tyrofermentans]|uniref:YaaA family protein n=1 Tax=Brachybacterium tyrofermentans TaxID=47848 RepID=UPI003FD67C4A
MLILLPPSETKTRPAPAEAAPLDLDAFGLPDLADSRRMMLRAAVRTAEARGGADKLGVPASSPELVARMAQVEQEPAAAPLSVYSGVLYDQLDPSRALPDDRRVLVQSALFGLVDAATDRIPAYRLSAASTVSRLGKAGSWWAPRLKPVAARLRTELAISGSPLVIDSRSGSYRSMMSMRSGAGVRVLEVSPVQERGGVRKVISHDAKRYRGLVTRALVDVEGTPTTADEVVDVVRAAFGTGLQVELDGDRLVVVDQVS